MIRLRKLLFYVVILITALMFISCGGSRGVKKSKDIKKIERQSKRNPAPTDMETTAKYTNSKKVKKALKKSEKKREAEAKAAKKAEKEGYKQHRAAQTEETRNRMDENLKLSKKINREAGITKKTSNRERKYKRK